MFSAAQYIYQQKKVLDNYFCRFLSIWKCYNLKFKFELFFFIFLSIFDHFQAIKKGVWATKV